MDWLQLVWMCRRVFLMSVSNDLIDVHLFLCVVQDESRSLRDADLEQYERLKAKLLGTTLALAARCGIGCVIDEGIAI